MRDKVLKASKCDIGTGCLICGKDDDHTNLMLCEGCNGEYHRYCLKIPLPNVPKEDWYCDTCRTKIEEDDDGLEDLVSTLSPSYTARFGEICWAHGGASFGWWPAFIYDPRLTVGNPRQEARKNVGKKHLVYFFECHNCPFGILKQDKIMSWAEGFAGGYHLGKVAKRVSKHRTLQFYQALQVATSEEKKPAEMRSTSWHTGKSKDSLSTVNNEGKNRLRRNAKSPLKISSRKHPRIDSTTQFSIVEDKLTDAATSEVVLCSNLDRKKLAITTPKVTNFPFERDSFLCQIVKKVFPSNDNHNQINIGFVSVTSRAESTFSDIREAIINELVPDFLPSVINWRFFVGLLGPVSRKQENSLGPVVPFLESTTPISTFGKGSAADPIVVSIVEYSTICLNL